MKKVNGVTVCLFVLVAVLAFVFVNELSYLRQQNAKEIQRMQGQIDFLYEFKTTPPKLLFHSCTVNEAIDIVGRHYYLSPKWELDSLGRVRNHKYGDGVDIVNGGEGHHESMHVPEVRQND